MGGCSTPIENVIFCTQQMAHITAETPETNWKYKSFTRTPNVEPHHTSLLQVCLIIDTITLPGLEAEYTDICVSCGVIFVS